jgi:hypothetical protein
MFIEDNMNYIFIEHLSAWKHRICFHIRGSQLIISSDMIKSNQTANAHTLTDQGNGCEDLSDPYNTTVSRVLSEWYL